jgi:rhamnosyltransferase
MNSQYHCPTVFAIIVTYNPDLDVLDTLVRCLLPQVGGAIIVDNRSESDVLEWHRKLQHEHLQFAATGENLGIAAAQNIGLAEARRWGAEFVLLSDQDSQPAADMVLQLRNAALGLASQGAKVAAVGPNYLDVRQNNPPFVRVNGLRVQWLTCSSKDSVLEVDYVIASGCLIPMQSVDAVGEMREEMFIDYVDVEWALRARRRGYRSYGVCAATMTHKHGDSPIPFMGKRYPSHSPVRHYYHFRNAIWLYKQRYVPLHWKMADGIHLVRKYFFYCLFAKPRFSHCRMMTIGLLDGIRSRLGRLELS